MDQKEGAVVVVRLLKLSGDLSINCFSFLHFACIKFLPAFFGF
jgi:hypothetical protein